MPILEYLSSYLEGVATGCGLYLMERRWCYGFDLRMAVVEHLLQPGLVVSGKAIGGGNCAYPYAIAERPP